MVIFVFSRDIEAERFLPFPAVDSCAIMNIILDEPSELVTLNNFYLPSSFFLRGIVNVNSAKVISFYNDKVCNYKENLESAK